MSVLKIKDENGIFQPVKTIRGAPGKTPQKGVDYFDGAPGAPGEPGKDYVLTEEDKQEIAGMVNASGGGDAWEHIDTLELTEMVNTWHIVLSKPCKKILLFTPEKLRSLALDSLNNYANVNSSPYCQINSSDINVNISLAMNTTGNSESRLVFLAETLGEYGCLFVNNSQTTANHLGGTVQRGINPNVKDTVIREVFTHFSNKTNILWNTGKFIIFGVPAQEEKS